MEWGRSLLCLFCLTAAGVMSYMLLDPLQDMWNNGVLGKFLALTSAGLVLTIAGLGLHQGWEVYLRATSERVDETLTVVTAETYLEEDTNIYFIGSVPIVEDVETWYTDITCEEYPEEVFTAEGDYDWQPGTKVPITLYFRNGERTDYYL